MQGYVLDEHNNIIKITTLYAATKYFEKQFREYHLDDERIHRFKIIDKIEGDYIMDYTKSFNREDAINLDRVSRGDIKKFAICWVAEVEFKSVFNTMDRKLYYIIFRSKWFNRWANTYYESAKRYFDKDGITMKIDILRHIRPNVDISTIVLVTGNCEIFYIEARPVFELANKKLGIFTDKWNQQCVGIPRMDFKDKDMNKYD